MSSDDMVAAIQQGVREISDPSPVGMPEGLRLTLERMISFSNADIRYGLRIERERTTASGKQGKPAPITLIVNNPGETVPDMLRTFAALIEQDHKAPVPA